MTLGKKIKDLRLSLGITQSELCGDTITRNMLSRIENDAALPSLPTLQYLSKRLGVSAGFFLDDAVDPLPYRKLSRLPAIKKLYADGAYADCLALCELLQEDDEIAAIKAACLLALGQTLYEKEQFLTAERFFVQARDTARGCLYDLSQLEQNAQNLISAIARAKEEKIPDLYPSEPGIASDTIEYSLYVYMLHVTQNTRYDLAASIYDTLKFTNTLYKKHINARLSLAALNTGRAVTLLSELVESFDETPCDPLFRLCVLKDLENAAHLAGNYEQAYKCLVKKNALMSGFEK